MISWEISWVSYPAFLSSLNDALLQQLSNSSKPVDTRTLRRILREELNKTR